MKTLICITVILFTVSLFSCVSFSDTSSISDTIILSEFENSTGNTYGPVCVSGITIKFFTDESNLYYNYRILRYCPGNRVSAYRLEKIIESVTDGFKSRSISLCTGRTTKIMNYIFNEETAEWVLVSTEVIIAIETPELLKRLTPVTYLFPQSSYAPGEVYPVLIPVNIPLYERGTSLNGTMEVRISELISGVPSAVIHEISSELNLSSIITSSSVDEYDVE